VNGLRPEQCHIFLEWISSRCSQIVQTETREPFDDMESLRTSHHSVENDSCRGRRIRTFRRTVLRLKKPAESMIDLTKQKSYIPSMIWTPRDVSYFVPGTNMS